MKTSRTAALLLALTLLAAAPIRAFAADDQTGTEEAGESTGPQVVDSLEGLNRGLFAVHKVGDKYLLEPVARLWDRILPDDFQRGINNFFQNLRFPANLVNSSLQGKGTDALTHTGRFLVNTTVGIAGLFDPATPMGLTATREDAGQSMAVYGWERSTYLMVPMMGPTTARDAIGGLLDGLIAIWPSLVEAAVAWPAFIVNGVNTRSLYLDELDTLEETSLDFYTAMRDGYDQRRAADILDSVEKTDEESDDLYYFAE